MDTGFVLPFKSEILRLKLKKHMCSTMYAVGDSLCPLGRSGFCVNFAHKECQFSAVSTICQDFLPWLVFEHLVQDSFSVEKLQLQNLWCEFSLLRAGCMREKHESRSVGLNRHLSPRKPLGCREVLAMEYFRGGTTWSSGYRSLSQKPDSSDLGGLESDLLEWTEKNDLSALWIS